MLSVNDGFIYCHVSKMRNRRINVKFHITCHFTNPHKLHRKKLCNSPYFKNKGQCSSSRLTHDRAIFQQFMNTSKISRRHAWQRCAHLSRLAMWIWVYTIKWPWFLKLLMKNASKFQEQNCQTLSVQMKQYIKGMVNCRTGALIWKWWEWWIHGWWEKLKILLVQNEGKCLQFYNLHVWFVCNNKRIPHKFH